MCDQQSLRSACAYAQSDQSLCKSLEYSMNVKLLTEQHLKFLSLKKSCIGSSESTLVKMPHCWKSHVTAHNVIVLYTSGCRPNNWHQRWMKINTIHFFAYVKGYKFSIFEIKVTEIKTGTTKAYNVKFHLT